MSNHYSVDDPAPAIQKFVSDYKSRYNGLAPDALAALGYDSLMVLADAISRAGTTDCGQVARRDRRDQEFRKRHRHHHYQRGTQRSQARRRARIAERKFVYKETIKPEGAVEVSQK